MVFGLTFALMTVQGFIPGHINFIKPRQGVSGVSCPDIRHTALVPHVSGGVWSLGSLVSLNNASGQFRAGLELSQNKIFFYSKENMTGFINYNENVGSSLSSINKCIFATTFH